MFGTLNVNKKKRNASDACAKHMILCGKKVLTKFEVPKESSCRLPTKAYK